MFNNVKKETNFTIDHVKVYAFQKFLGVIGESLPLEKMKEYACFYAVIIIKI
jgi:hypothetical protein